MTRGELTHNWNTILIGNALFQVQRRRLVDACFASTACRRQLCRAVAEMKVFAGFEEAAGCHQGGAEGERKKRGSERGVHAG